MAVTIEWGSFNEKNPWGSKSTPIVEKSSLAAAQRRYTAMRKHQDGQPLTPEELLLLEDGDAAIQRAVGTRPMDE